MNPSQLRVLLNSLAGLLGTGGTTALAMGHPVLALAASNAVLFLVAWANLSKPGEIAIKKLPPEVQAVISGAPPPPAPDSSGDRETPPAPPTQGPA